VLRALYDRTMRLAAHRHALWWLAVIAFVESSVFPIPPDVLLIPIIIANRDKAFRIAAICTASSVVGGFFGYGIGYYFQETVGQWILDTYHLTEQYRSMQALFAEWGAWIIVVKGATPIPYKLLTIASGMLHFDIWQFTTASIISRAFRFFLVATLLWRFGAPIQTFVEERLTLVTTLFVVALIGGFVAVTYL